MSLQFVGNSLSAQQIFHLLHRQFLAGPRPAAAASVVARVPGKYCPRVRARRKIRPGSVLDSQRLKRASTLKITAEE